MRILITPTSLGPTSAEPGMAELRAFCPDLVFNTTGRPLTSSELRQLLPGVTGVIAGLDEYDSAALTAADSLVVISRYGAGYDRVDLAAARAHGIAVTNTPGANSTAVAELAIGLLFAVARSISRLDREVHAGGWPRSQGIELTGKTFGVIGVGSIGRLVAARARGLGMRVLGYDPAVPAPVLAAASIEPADLDTLVSESHVVSLHVPLLPETRHLLDARRIAMLPRGAIVLNTSRGGLLDDQAAANALLAGHLAGIGVDVYEQEPPQDSPLIGLAGVVTTPHTGAHTAEAVSRMTTMAVRNLIDVLTGRDCRYRVSPR